MSKKRLEEIEAKYSILTMTSEKNGTEYIEVDVEDLVFLIQNSFKQAERVHELETFKEEMENRYKLWHIGAKKVLAEKEELKQQNKRLREALEFYADEENWISALTSIGDFPCEVEKDQGEIARKALEGEK